MSSLPEPRATRPLAEDLDLRARRRRQPDGAPRAAYLATGVVLLGLGVRRRGMGGALLALAGGTLAARGGRGARGDESEPRSLLARGAGAAPVLARAVTIGAPPEEIRGICREPARVAGALRFAERLEQTAEGRMHVVCALPGIGRSEWRLARTEDADDRVVWESEPDGGARCRLTLALQPAPGARGTELLARLRVEPDARWAAAGLRALRPVSERALGRELARVKQWIETGEVATASPQPAGPRSAKRRAVGFLAAPAGPAGLEAR